MDATWPGDEYPQLRRWLESYVIRRLLTSREEVEDLVQEAFCATLGALRAGEIETTPTKYLFGTIRYLVMQWRRESARRRTSVEMDARIPYEAPDPEQACIERELHDRLAGLRTLRPIELAIWRRRIEGDDPHAIRRDLGLSEGQFRNHQARGKQHLLVLARASFKLQAAA